MQVNGRCHCGAITYRAELDPEKVALCYCTDCQMLTGSAFRASVPVSRADFELFSGQPKRYIKTAESGAKRVQAFCPDSGTSVYSSALIDPPTLSLRIGCLEQRGQLPPRKQIWRCSALDWVDHVGDVPQLVRQ
jgi:hypothetical protein